MLIVAVSHEIQTGIDQQTSAVIKSLFRAQTHKYWLNDQWFKGTFSTNRLYCAFEKYVEVKKNEMNEKGDNVMCWEYIK